MLASACAITFAQAQDEPPANNEGSEPQMRERGNKRGDRQNMRNNRSGGMNGMMPGGMGGGMTGMTGMAGGGMNTERTKAESELAKKAPEDFAVLVKEREALEAKFQALAKKNDVKLPLTAEARRAQMEAFNKKYEKELAGIREQMKTDPKGAMEKMRALMKAEGIEFAMPTRAMRDTKDAKADGEAKAAPRANRNQEMRQAVKKAYPDEFRKMEELRRDNPQEARELMKKLMDKYAAEHKEDVPPPPPVDNEAK